MRFMKTYDEKASFKAKLLVKLLESPIVQLEEEPKTFIV